MNSPASNRWTQIKQAIKSCVPSAIANKIFRVPVTPTEPKPSTVLIHIGKCGGSTLRTALEKIADTFPVQIVHVEKPVYNPEHSYIIVARSPISRAISAFNWRYKLVVTDGTQHDRFKGEQEVLRRYGSLNTIAEALYDNDGNPNKAVHGDIRKIHHLREDIGFYLSGLLPQCQPGQVTAVLMQENLNADIQRVFGVAAGEREKDNSKVSTNTLSRQAEENLRRFFKPDYEALALLHSWGLIEDTVFAALR
jgi:hypothetical protein